MKSKYRNLLKEYNHSIPIIYSHIERQYHYDILFDNDENYGILLTCFDYNFAFGDIPKNRGKFINYIREYIKDNEKDEFIIFGPNILWEKFLSKVFKDINGTKDIRCLYYLNENKFKEYNTTNKFVKLEYIKDRNSMIEYPQASTYVDNKLISYSRAFMIGHHEAELDVWTDKKLRQKGYGFDGSLCLIEHLLKINIKPNWSCWESKTLSNSLAKKLGFELFDRYYAFIWVQDFGEF